MKSTLDFIVIGAQKAGTTSLFEYLRQHPELSLPATKEAPFFSHEPVYRRGFDDYLRKAFGIADANTRWGTVTPQYMVGGLWEQPNPGEDGRGFDERTVPLRIRELLPEVRLIAILRDPVQRARSHHRMAAMNKIEARTFERAVEDLLQPEALTDARREPREQAGYVVWGEYGRILAGYFEVFRSEQILVLFTDELERDAAGVLRRIYEFLGVQADFLPDNVGTRYREGGTDLRVPWIGTYTRLNPWALQRALARSSAAKRLWHALPGRRRRQFDRLFGGMSYRLDLWNRRTAAQAESADDASVLRLRAHYDADARLLTDLLGADPPWQR